MNFGKALDTLSDAGGRSETALAPAEAGVDAARASRAQGIPAAPVAAQQNSAALDAAHTRQAISSGNAAGQDLALTRRPQGSVPQEEQAVSELYSLEPQSSPFDKQPTAAAPVRPYKDPQMTAASQHADSQRVLYETAHELGSETTLKNPRDKVSASKDGIQPQYVTAFETMKKHGQDLDETLQALKTTEKGQPEISVEAQDELIKNADILTENAKFLSAAPVGTAQEMRAMRDAFTMAMEVLPRKKAVPVLKEMHKTETAQSFSSAVYRDHLDSSAMKPHDPSQPLAHREATAWTAAYPELETMRAETLDAFGQTMTADRRTALFDGGWDVMHEPHKTAFLEGIATDLAEHMGIATTFQRLQRSARHTDGPIPQSLAREMVPAWEAQPLKLSFIDDPDANPASGFNIGSNNTLTLKIEFPRHELSQNTGAENASVLFHEMVHARQNLNLTLYEQVRGSNYIANLPAVERPDAITDILEKLNVPPEHARLNYLAQDVQVDDIVDSANLRRFYFDDIGESEAWDMETAGLVQLTQSARAQTPQTLHDPLNKTPNRVLADVDWQGTDVVMGFT